MPDCCFISKAYRHVEDAVNIRHLISSALVLGLALPVAAAKCGGDSAQLVGGEVVGSDSLTAYRAVDYKLTSENYRRWLQAQSALDSVNVDARVRLNTRRLTDDDIDSVVEELQAHKTARPAIESSGLSVKDYVLTTIALAQSWDAVKTPGERFRNVPQENVAFLRRGVDDSVVRTRPRARILDDDSDGDSDSDSESDRDKRKKHKGRGSDSDS